MGTLDTLYVAKYKGRWFRILGDLSDGFCIFSDNFEENKPFQIPIIAKYLQLVRYITCSRHRTLQKFGFQFSKSLLRVRCREQVKRLGTYPILKPWGTVQISSPNTEVECIKYDILDFCNHLFVAANFPFENNRVLLWWISVVTNL